MGGGGGESKPSRLAGWARAPGRWVRELPWPRGRDVRRRARSKRRQGENASGWQAAVVRELAGSKGRLVGWVHNLVFYVDKALGRPEVKGSVAALGRFGQRVESLGKLRPAWPLVLVAALAGMSLAIGIYALARPNAVVVEVEGRPIGVARAEAVVRETVAALEQELAAQGWVRPENYRRLTLKPVRAAAAQVLTPEVLRSRLREALAFQVQAVAIQVNGRAVVWVKDRATAEQVLARVREGFVPQDGKVLRVAVEEKVDFISGEVKTSEVATPEEAIQLLREGVPRSQQYTVVAGDSLWSIARAHGMTVEDLRAANPQIKGEYLQIGDELNLVKAQPVLHVVVTREVRVEEKIPYAVKMVSDASLYRGQEKVKQDGEPGIRAVTYRLVERNGAPVVKEEVHREVLREPVTKIVARGTKRIVVASRGGGSGELGWPVSGQITSGYGWRGREFHAAVDIGASYGAAVRAAAGGTVVYAGRDGGYGRTVVIDHGDGLVTRYAHLSHVSVEPGQKVERGETIGAVGESGRATGPHLHFEVLVNGSRRNPLNYLR